MSILRQCGSSITLLPENPQEKCYDGVLDGRKAEIKAIEGTGVWAVRPKLSYALKQGAEAVILYFPERDKYSHDKVKNGLNLFKNDPHSSAEQSNLTDIIVIVGEDVVEKIKPPW